MNRYDPTARLFYSFFPLFLFFPPPLTTQPQPPGQVAVVTGTNGGLGSAIAEAFALEGADVLCAYHSPKAVQTAPEDGSSSGGGRKRSKVEVWQA